MTDGRLPAVVLLPVLIGACAGASASPSPTPPSACVKAAQDVQGSVVAFSRSTVRAIQLLPAVNSNPQLDSYPSDEAAIICYIDGAIQKAPPPPATGPIPPPFDRAVFVVVGSTSILIAAGYRQNLPTQSP